MKTKIKPLIGLCLAASTVVALTIVANRALRPTSGDDAQLHAIQTDTLKKVVTDTVISKQPRASKLRRVSGKRSNLQPAQPRRYDLRPEDETPNTPQQ